VQQGDPIFLLNLDQTAPQVNSTQATVNATVAARNTAAQQLGVAQSQLASAQSQYELARVNNDRYQYLVSQGAVDRATGDQFATTLKVQGDAVNKPAIRSKRRAQQLIRQRRIFARLKPMQPPQKSASPSSK